MKYFIVKATLISLFISCFPVFILWGQKDLSKEWSSLDSLGRYGLYQQAEVKAIEIHQTLAGTNDIAGQFKAFCSILKFGSYYKENSEMDNLTLLEQEILTAKAPFKNLLLSLKAATYDELYQRQWGYHYYYSEEKKKAGDDLSPDPRNWSREKLVKTIESSYMASLENKALLILQSLENYRTVISGDSSYRDLRGTLYDYLTHKAIQYFIQSDYKSASLGKEFSFNDPAYFQVLEAFTNLKPVVENPASHGYVAFLLFQDLVKYHLNSGNPEALVYLEYERLQKFADKSSLAQKDSLQWISLKQLGEKYKDSSAGAMILYYQAGFIKDHPSTIASSLEMKPRVKIITLLKTLKENYPGSIYAEEAEKLASAIQMPALEIQTPAHIYPGDPTLALVSYTNTDSIRFTIYKADQKTFEEVILPYQSKYEEKLPVIQALPIVYTTTKRFPAFHDYEQHAAEWIIPAQEAGYYVLITENIQTGSKTTRAVKMNALVCNSATWIRMEHDAIQQTLNGYIVDRKTGKGIKGATLELFKRQYNYSTYTYESVKVKTLQSGKDGKVTGSIPDDMRELEYHLRWKKEPVVKERDYIYNYYYENDTNIVSTLFTDRSIYRPGQTVYFKGIAHQKTAQGFQTIAGKKIVITLSDPNYQRKELMELVTNDYGSYSGSFTLPSSGLNGMFTLEDNISASVGIQMEEYKRPKFEVKVNVPKDTYKLGDSVTVSGSADALGGFAIDGASVSYRVTRSQRWYYFDYYGMGGKYIYPPSYGEKVEIISGTTTTDRLGQFSLRFPATPDPSLPLASQASFDFQVEVSVTDLTGETRTASVTVPMGYRSLNISLSVPSTSELSEQQEISASLTNLSGEIQQGNMVLKLYELSGPGHYLKDRSWTEIPDTSLDYTRDAFKKLFPNDYFRENDRTYTKGKLLATISHASGENKTIRFTDLNIVKEGYYVLVAEAQDPDAGLFTQETRFSVLDKRSKTSVEKFLFYSHVPKSSYKPGETAEIIVGSGAEGLNLRMMIETEKGLGKPQYINLSNRQELIKIPVATNFTGNIYVHFMGVIRDEMVNEIVTIYVPDSSRHLDIKLTSFRDITLPGSKEEWSLKVTGQGQEAVVAEILASMYDGSLDAYAYSPDYYIYTNDSYINRYRWHYTTLNTNNISSNLYRIPYGYYFRYPVFENLNFFGAITGASYWLYKDNEMEAAGAYTTAIPFTVDGNGIRDKTGSGERGNSSAGIISEANKSVSEDEKALPAPAPPPGVRKNFQETAFFYPDLKTNEKGEVSFQFTTPESITRWKFRALAHTTSLKTASISQEITTKKDLMVNSFAPRFLRETDALVYSAKVSNLTDTELSGQARLEIRDALTGKLIDIEMKNINPYIQIKIPAKESILLEWNIEVPQGLQAVTFNILAGAGNHEDGEEMTLPVLSNRTLLTESLPLVILDRGSRNFRFKGLGSQTSSNTIKPYHLTVEFTSNPVWFALQSLPYLLEYPYECSEQTFARFYANSVASYIADSFPVIREMLSLWKNIQPEVFMAELEKRPELKSALLEETPWVLDATDEAERKKRLALLLDLNKIASDETANLQKLTRMQSPNGGWPWFDGGPDNRYITQHIVAGLGKLNEQRPIQDQNLLNAITKAISYLENKLIEDVKRVQRDSLYKKANYPLSLELHTLYAISYFDGYGIASDSMKAAKDFLLTEAEKNWAKYPLLDKGMLAILFHQNKQSKQANTVLASLKEGSVFSEDKGRYWKQTYGWNWNESPIETHTLLLEAFSKISTEPTVIAEIKAWLLIQKKVNDWGNTIATSNAIAAILQGNKNLTQNDPVIAIRLGETFIDPAQDPTLRQEAGSGYFSKTLEASEIKPSMEDIEVLKASPGPGFGAVHYQFFVDIDKIALNNLSPLKIDRKLFVERVTKDGPVYEEITAKTSLSTGDRILVKLFIQTDRSMEFVHVKDLRAAGLEPENVLSGYRYRSDLFYYETTRDLSTSFFIDYLPRGTYQLEYTARITHEGNFSAGYATIQNLYAPEFGTHSAGTRLMITPQ